MFDVQAVQGVVWADFKKTGDVLTEYDEQQARLRRQLEQQRHDIEQAGGVKSEDDDDAAA
jgi:superfamily I DNA and/or RNA helicase